MTQETNEETKQKLVGCLFDLASMPIGFIASAWFAFAIKIAFNWLLVPTFNLSPISFIKVWAAVFVLRVAIAERTSKTNLAPAMDRFVTNVIFWIIGPPIIILEAWIVSLFIGGGQ